MIQSLTQASLEATFKAAVGYGIGFFTQTNELLWAAILAVQAIARPIFTALGVKIFGEKHTTVVTEATRTAAQMIAIIAIRAAGLISLRVAGLFGFISFGLLLGRIKHHHTPSI